VETEEQVLWGKLGRPRWRKREINEGEQKGGSKVKKRVGVWWKGESFLSQVTQNWKWRRKKKACNDGLFVWTRA